MSWSLFAIIQLGVTAVGVIGALWLRNRELRMHVSVMETTRAEAGEALAEAKTKLESTENHKTWLKERVTALEGDDPVTLVQRMVLKNESKPSNEFNEELSAQLAAGSNIEESWSGLRTAHHELTVNLIGSAPSQHASIVKLYEVFSSLDKSLAVDLPALPEAEESGGDQSGDEQLRSENTQLQQQSESAREALLAVGEEDSQNTTSDEDLKSLLQQFTRDSRDMMICIQMLEAENLKLRNRFEESKQNTPSNTETSGTESGTSTTESAESGTSSDTLPEQTLANAIEETAARSAEESAAVPTEETTPTEQPVELTEPAPTEEPTALAEPTATEEPATTEEPSAAEESTELQSEPAPPLPDSADEELDEVNDADIEAILASIADENEEDAA